MLTFQLGVSPSAQETISLVDTRMLQRPLEWVGDVAGEEVRGSLRITAATQPFTRDFTARKHTLTLRAKCCRYKS